MTTGRVAKEQNTEGIEPDGEAETIELVNDKTGEMENFLVHDVIELGGQTYYLLQAEVDENRTLILRREGESLVTLDEEEQGRVLDELEQLADEEEEDDSEDNSQN